MERRWVVRPDQMLYTEAHGEVPCVSREAMRDAFMDAESLVARAGGHVSVSTTRHPTGFEGEMVTTAAAFVWRDRTDAKAQPEQANVPVAEPTPAVAPEPIEESPIVAAGRAAIEAQHHASSVGIGDGLDESTLDEEDLSSVPESVR